MDKQRQVKLELLKAVAPILVKEGNDLMSRLVGNGNDPHSCTIDGMPIMDAYALNAMEWVDALYNAYMDGTKPKIDE